MNSWEVLTSNVRNEYSRVSCAKRRMWNFVYLVMEKKLPPSIYLATLQRPRLKETLAIWVWLVRLSFTGNEGNNPPLPASLNHPLAPHMAVTFEPHVVKRNGCLYDLSKMPALK